MRIKHLHLENFCGLKEFDSDFSDRTLVSGKNETGKSTVRNAIFYVLTGKLADGSAADGIRPCDKNGEPINFVDIVVELETEHEGRNITFKKVQHQKWVSHRGSNEKSYEGDETLCEINGVPKKIKDYEYGIQFASFYMPGNFVPQVRMMKTGRENIELAKKFGFPYVVPLKA